MERVRFITHKGKQVLLLDYHDLSDEAETLAMIEDRKEMVASQPKAQLRSVGYAISRPPRTIVARSLAIATSQIACLSASIAQGKNTCSMITMA